MSTPVLERPRRAVRQAEHHAREAAREARPWVERLGRLGHLAIGAVYAVIGLLAAQAARGEGGATTDKEGALSWIAQAPFGRFLMAAIAIGMVGYALWRFVQAFRDTENKGTDPQGLFARAGYAVIGLLYLTAAGSAASLALGAGGEQGDATRDWTATLMSKPFGQWLVGLLGAIVLGTAVYQLYLAWSAKFAEQMKRHEMTAEQETWTERAGRLGYGARGVAFGIVGLFLIVAAVRAEPGEARGLGGALATLAEQPFGPWLLLAVAVGLIAYGAFMLLQARFRRMVIR